MQRDCVIDGHQEPENHITMVYRSAIEYILKFKELSKA